MTTRKKAIDTAMYKIRKDNTMKKLLAIAFSTLMMMSLSACNDSDNESLESFDMWSSDSSNATDNKPDKNAQTGDDYPMSLSYEKDGDDIAVGYYMLLDLYDVVELEQITTDEADSCIMGIADGTAASMALIHTTYMADTDYYTYRVSAIEEGIAVFETDDQAKYLIIKVCDGGEKKFTSEDVENLYKNADKHGAKYLEAVASVARSLDDDEKENVGNDVMGELEEQTVTSITQITTTFDEDYVPPEVEKLTSTTTGRNNPVTTTTVTTKTPTTTTTTTPKKTETTTTTTTTTTTYSELDLAPYKMDSVLQAYYNLAHDCATEQDKKIIIDDVDAYIRGFNGSTNVTIFASSETKKDTINVPNGISLRKNTGLYAWKGNTKDKVAANNQHGNASFVSSLSSATFAQDDGLYDQLAKAESAYRYAVAFRKSCKETFDDFAGDNKSIFNTAMIEYNIEIFSAGKTNSGRTKYYVAFLYNTNPRG